MFPIEDIRAGILVSGHVFTGMCAFISGKLDEFIQIRKEISSVLKVVEKLEKDSAKKNKK